MGNVAIFIDAEYVLQSLRTLADKPSYEKIRKESFNWTQFIHYVSNARPITVVNYYTARLDETENKETYDNQTIFLEQVKTALARYNVQMRLGKMIKIKKQNAENMERTT